MSLFEKWVSEPEGSFRQGKEKWIQRQPQGYLNALISFIKL